MANTGTDGQPIKTVVAEVMQQIERRCQPRSNGAHRIPTGIAGVDEFAGGLRRGELIVVAGATGMGKSAFTSTIARNVARSAHVAVFSLDVSAGIYCERLMGAQSKVDTIRLGRGMLEENHWAALRKGAAELAGSKMVIEVLVAPDHCGLRARARRLLADRAVDERGLVIVDYLQLIDGCRPGAADREGQIDATCAGMKQVAVELQVPVLLVCSFENLVQPPYDPRPTLAQLRRQVPVERHADVLLFVHRPEVYQWNSPDEDRGIVEVIVSKDASGPVGTVRLAFSKQFYRFDDIRG